MRVVSLKINSNVYPLKNTNSHYLLLNTTIITLCNSKISLIFFEGNNTFDVRIKWLMQKVKNLFRVKDKPLHQACKIYEGACPCGKSYTGETVRNAEVHWG